VAFSPVSFCASVITCAGPLGILGFTFGLTGVRRREGHGMAVAGIVMNGIVTAVAVFVVAFFGLGAILGLFGATSSP
jgi:hypothetical protein